MIAGEGGKQCGERERIRIDFPLVSFIAHLLKAKAFQSLQDNIF